MAGYDTKISVFEKVNNDLVCVGGQDDAAGCPGFTTDLSLPTVCGSEYAIFIHGFASDTGNFDLSISAEAPCALPIPTLSQWGIIILFFSLISFGLVYLRSKKQALA
jgi:hypothetical protein